MCQVSEAGMTRQERRGRRRTFDSGRRDLLAEMVRLYGARPARDLSAVPISVGTLLKIAQEYNIPLKKGRRPRKAA